MPDVTPREADPTLREQTIHLVKRLDRIGAAADTPRTLVFEIRHDVPSGPTVALLETLDRDLVLALHELQVRERAARELASLR